MAKFPAVLPLPSSPPSEVPPPASQAKAEIPQPLWLALVFPKLALEVHDDYRHDIPAAAVKEYKGRSVVHTASRSAERQGVGAGMPVNAAYALCPGLKVYSVEEQSRLGRLQRLAAWAEQFTSRVSVQPPRALLLEVRGSLKLFGGLSALQNRIQQQLAEQWQHSFYSAVAPTPMASLLLAGSGQSDAVQEKRQLRSVLGRLPVNKLPIGHKRIQQLRNSGVRVLRDLWRLPREGLARRFGPELINYLDRTLGLAPDPLEFFASPEAFEAHYEFPMEVRSADLLFNVAEQLLQQLSVFLRQRDACINQCEFRLIHGGHAATGVMVGVRQATHDHRRLAGLFEEHLSRLSLEAPVRSIRLAARDFVPFSPQTLPLFDDPGLDQAFYCEDGDIDSLLEQLQARMGHDAIKTVHSVADHRPEYACQLDQAAKRKSGQSRQRRPFWLLPEPRLLSQKDGRPRLRGALKLVEGPERIQAGWWSGHDVRRDYYIALDSKGCRLWIYQALGEDRRWYLHGLFA